MRRSIDLKGSILSSITVGECELVMSFIRAMVVERPSDQSGGPAVRSTRRLDLKIMKPGLTTVLNRLPSQITGGRILLREASFNDAVPLPLVHLGPTEFKCHTENDECVRVTGSGAVVVFLNEPEDDAAAEE